MQHGSNKFLKDCLISSPVQLDLSGKSRLSTEQVSDNKILSVFTDENAKNSDSLNTDLLPDEIKAEIEYLNNNGMKAGIDYSVTLQDNGDYVLEYLTNYARGFGSIAKRIYHKDGTQSVITKALYKENSQENWDKFNIEDTDFADKLYKQEGKIFITDSEYSQKINNVNFEVKLDTDKIFIKKNGEQFSIDTSNIPEAMKKVLFGANPAALFRIAKQGIRIKFETPPDGGDAQWLPFEKTIYIEPDNSEVRILQRRIAHEAGHSYYTDDMPVNEELEEIFAEETDIYNAEIFEIESSFDAGNNDLKTMAEIHEALKKFDKYAPEMDNTRYCAKNVYEFVAEAYCLLVTGHAKSEFTIAKVYPKTFELVKKLIEEEDKLD